MRNYVIGKPTFSPKLNIPVTEAQGEDEAPTGVWVELPNGDRVIISKEFIDTYDNVFRFIQEQNPLIKF